MSRPDQADVRPSAGALHFAFTVFAIPANRRPICFKPGPELGAGVMDARQLGLEQEEAGFFLHAPVDQPNTSSEA